MPSTLRSGTAPLGKSPVSATSTVIVPFCTDGSMRDTRPAPRRCACRLGVLADLDILGLRFRDLDFRFQAARIRDPCEVRARGDLRADFHRHNLENPVQAGPDLELVALPLLQLEERSGLIDLGVLRGKLRVLRVLIRLKQLLGDPIAHF